MVKEPPTVANTSNPSKLLTYCNLFKVQLPAIIFSAGKRITRISDPSRARLPTDSKTGKFVSTNLQLPILKAPGISFNNGIFKAFITENTALPVVGFTLSALHFSRAGKSTVYESASPTVRVPPTRVIRGKLTRSIAKPEIAISPSTVFNEPTSNFLTVPANVKLRPTSSSKGQTNSCARLFCTVKSRPTFFKAGR